jgi:hypothetical protein
VHVERQLGVSVMFYDSDFGSLPIIPSRYIKPDGSASETKMYVYCEKTEAENLIEVATLQELGSQPLAKIDDSERFMVNEYETLVNRAPQWSAVADNLTADPDGLRPARSAPSPARPSRRRPQRSRPSRTRSSPQRPHVVRPHRAADQHGQRADPALQRAHALRRDRRGAAPPARSPPAHDGTAKTAQNLFTPF